MILKRERADGTVIVSGEINTYKDFRSCVCGCAENREARIILLNFGRKNNEKWEEFMPKLERDFVLQEQKRRAAALEN